MRNWAPVTVAVVVSGLLLTVGRGSYEGPSWVEVTVVPGDAKALGCAGVVGSRSCAFAADGTAVEVARPLRPFVTTSGRLVVLPGLFEDEGVARWLDHPKSLEERVRVRCEARRVADDLDLPIRFGAAEAFGARRVTVGEISACVVY